MADTTSGAETLTYSCSRGDRLCDECEAAKYDQDSKDNSLKGFL